MTRPNRFDLAVFAALAAVMLATRTHSLSQIVHLPDTSLASFFAAGYYIRARAAFPALFALGFAIDLVMIRLLSTPDFCFTIAYALLVPAYGVMWAAGRWAHGRLAPKPAALPAVSATICVASLGAEIIASGGFYAFSGRFADPTLAGFGIRLLHYYPYTLLAALTWTGAAAATHVAVLQLRQLLRAGAR